MAKNEVEDEEESPPTLTGKSGNMFPESITAWLPRRLQCMLVFIIAFQMVAFFTGETSLQKCVSMRR